MKTVKRLKDKHRNGLWTDRDGDLWFYNLGQDEGWRCIQFTGAESVLGVADESAERVPAAFGPFRRIHKLKS